MCGLDSLLRWNGTGRAAVDDHADDDDGAADEPSEDEVADWVPSTDKELLVSSLIQHRVLLSFLLLYNKYPDDLENQPQNSTIQ